MSLDESDFLEHELGAFRRKYAKLEQDVVPAANRIVHTIDMLRQQALSKDSVLHAIKRIVQTVRMKRRKTTTDDDEDSGADVEETLHWALDAEFFAWCKTPSIIVCDIVRQAIHDALTVIAFENTDFTDEDYTADMLDYPQMTTILLYHVLSTVTTSDTFDRELNDVIRVAVHNHNDYNCGTVLNCCRPAFATFFAHVFTLTTRHSAPS